MTCRNRGSDGRLIHSLSSSENVGCNVCLSIAKDIHQRVHTSTYQHSQRDKNGGLVTANSCQLSSALLEELKGFCENTTIRGLPRIVRARTRTFRLLWSTFVGALTISCLVCMFFLARQYYAYDVIHPPRVLRNAPSPFPSFTVCNLRPISPGGLQYLETKNWVTPREYVKRLVNYRTLLYNKDIEMFYSLSAGFTLAGYLESLGNNTERQKLGHQPEKFILKCYCDQRVSVLNCLLSLRSPQRFKYPLRPIHGIVLYAGIYGTWATMLYQRSYIGSIFLSCGNVLQGVYIGTFITNSSKRYFTVHCPMQMTYLSGGKPVSIPCTSRSKQRNFIHAQYLNCFTFDPDPNLRTKIMSVEIYLHLNEMPEHVTCPDCFLVELKSQLSGALLAIHANGQLPIINDKSINLKPGSLTEVRLATYLNVQKQPPHGQCDPNVPSVLHLYDSSFDYSEYGCLEAARQSGIIRKCGCYGLEMPYNELSGTPPCGRLTSFIDRSICNSVRVNTTVDNTRDAQCVDKFEQFAKRIHCKQQVMETYVHGDKMTCAMPCSFYSYETELSTSYWPTKTMQLTWLNSSFGERLGFYADSRFSAYKRAQKLLLQGNHSLAGEILATTNTLERNLVAVLINRPNFDVQKVEEKEVLSMTSMLSQTGGLFSMWMGLTLISVGEVIELIAKCVTKVTKHINKRRKRSSGYDSQQKSDSIISTGDSRNQEHFVSKSDAGNHCLSAQKCCCCVYIFPASDASDIGCRTFPLQLHFSDLLLPRKVCEHHTDDPNTGQEIHRHGDSIVPHTEREDVNFSLNSRSNDHDIAVTEAGSHDTCSKQSPLE